MDQSESSDDSVFVGISIGCNKGFDAIETMRMGTWDPIFDKDDWREARNETRKDPTIDNRCGEANDYRQFVLGGDMKARRGEMHCVEAVPTNYEVLRNATRAFDLESKGFVVTHAAISDRNGSLFFPDGRKNKRGVENLGISDCAGKSGNAAKLHECVKVDAYRLDTFVDLYVKSTKSINHLSIDIEGYDADAILSAARTLKRVEYVEFEYNWMGSWVKHELKDIIQTLDDNDFSCYWIGNDELWRITWCWLNHYENRYWSNIGCVHRTLAPQLHEKVESKFLKTLSIERSSLSYISRHNLNVLNL